MEFVNENARLWRRFIARWIDMSAYAVLVVVFIMKGVLALFPSGRDILRGLMEFPIVFNVMAMAPWIIVETVLLATWGTTPGKALLKVQITNAGGGKPSLHQAFRRSLSVFIKGYGMGIGYLAALEMLWWHFRLTKTEQRNTPWDENGGFEIRYGDLGVAQMGFAVASVPLILICFYLLLTSWNR